MEVLVGFGGRVPLSRRESKKRYFNIRAHRASFKVEEENDDPFFQAAIQRASLRLRESHSPGNSILYTYAYPFLPLHITHFQHACALMDPLLVDPYVGCLLPSNSLEDMDQQLHPYCLATKFIDDKLLETMQSTDGLKQVVLLTDGLDTRPYRLNWPTSTLLFDICPEKVFRRAVKKLQAHEAYPNGTAVDDIEAGAKIPRGCMSFHVPSESFDIENILRSKGFSGTRPSIWAFQGLPVVNLASFKDILSLASNLAMKGCLFLGELPGWMAETEVGDQSATLKWLDDLFMSYGFRVKIIEYDEVARNLGKNSAKRASGVGTSILFVAEHLRFSDDQMETWRTEFQRIEEEGDEEGFEEL
ncbi:hypothetical protein RND71_007002 [Anisodus tanguticus]|uniref:S-adenosyl-L-methionine-dependent methyltransferase n=1 Tax=Anisodus tanguticus TaxID=243964 RepID=A0AAE1SV30_9SOLA|nr:hypothetical protein RND71_007002 [Anisodus tanguticus]